MMYKEILPYMWILLSLDDAPETLSAMTSANLKLEEQSVKPVLDGVLKDSKRRIKLESCNKPEADPDATHNSLGLVRNILYIHHRQRYRCRQETMAGNSEGSESGSESWVRYQGAGDEGESRAGEVGNGKSKRGMLESLAWKVAKNNLAVSVWQAGV